MKVHFPAVEVRDDRLMLTDAQKLQVRYLLDRQKAPYLQVTFQAPFRPRSTGKGSQSARINGFVAQIAAHTGDDFETVKIRCKQKAIGRGWPFITVEEDIDGVMHEFRVAKSEADASVEEARYLIEAVEQMAAEVGCVLVEE